MSLLAKSHIMAQEDFELVQPAKDGNTDSKVCAGSMSTVRDILQEDSYYTAVFS
jgi:hypothetical protein